MTRRGDAIVLIGFMGSGKTSVGRLLAARTGWPRYDTDEFVRARLGLPIAKIFATLGETVFRDAESAVLEEIAPQEAIIVTGGGIILRPANLPVLRRLGHIVHLLADEETLFRRVSRTRSRPLLQTENPRATLAALWEERAPLYRKAADLTIDTSGLRPAQVATAILRELKM